MTTKEQQTIDNLLQSVRDMREENRIFRDDMSAIVLEINSKTEKKIMPIYHEQDILKTAQLAIQEAIGKALIGYQSPLTKLTESVINEHSSDLRNIISNSFSTVIKTQEFKDSIVSAFAHKVSRSIISNNDGLFDKVSNELKQDSLFKAKMAMAVSNVVEECLKERSLQS